MNISCIIITAFRKECLVKSLSALASELTADDEVIVVSASRPVFERELAAGRPNWEVLESERMNMPYQRNIGIKAARNEIVAFVDDDARVQPRWRNELLSCYSAADVASVVGKENMVGYEGIESARQPGISFWGTITGLRFFTAADVCEVETGQGCNMSFRKTALEQIGLFDDNYLVKSYGEETDVFIRLRRAGMKVIYNPRAVVIHEPAEPVDYTRSAFDKKGVYYQNRNYAYFFTKWFFLRTQFFGHLIGGMLSFGWLCCKRVALVVSHTCLVFFLCIAGSIAGIYEGIRVKVGSGSRKP